MFRTPEIVICCLVLGTVAVIYLITQLLRAVVDQESSTPVLGEFQESWIFRLSLNLLGYATIIVPGFLIYRYVKQTNYLERSGLGCFPALVRLCLAGPEPAVGDGLAPSPLPQKTYSTMQQVILLMFCFLGLQLTYLTWGLLQEKVMTQEYEGADGVKGNFKDSQFLVFVNRILAFTLSGVYVLLMRQPRHSAPLYKYVYCSFSNIMSSWCQYEALKFVSFPTQVLAKASKIIPVMIMGKFVSRRKYESYEYITAFFISLGMALFMFGSSDHVSEAAGATTLSGLVLLAGYMLCDSFTSNWQGELFSQYAMSSVQMMCGVNLFSCLFTAVSLVQQGGFVHSLRFMAQMLCRHCVSMHKRGCQSRDGVLQFPKFSLDCMILSLCSAAGQLFIFFTIAVFGPVVFVIIMTVRQGLAILLSCIIYQHHVTVVGVAGIVTVFVSVFLRIYCSQRLKAIRSRRSQATLVPAKV